MIGEDWLYQTSHLNNLFGFERGKIKLEEHWLPTENQSEFDLD